MEDTLQSASTLRNERVSQFRNEDVPSVEGSASSPSSCTGMTAAASFGRRHRTSPNFSHVTGQNTDETLSWEAAADSLDNYACLHSSSGSTQKTGGVDARGLLRKLLGFKRPVGCASSTGSSSRRSCNSDRIAADWQPQPQQPVAASHDAAADSRCSLLPDTLADTHPNIKLCCGPVLSVSSEELCDILVVQKALQVARSTLATRLQPAALNLPSPNQHSVASDSHASAQLLQGEITRPKTAPEQQQQEQQGSRPAVMPASAPTRGPTHVLNGSLNASPTEASTGQAGARPGAQPQPQPQLPPQSLSQQQTATEAAAEGTAGPVVSRLMHATAQVSYEALCAQRSPLTPRSHIRQLHQQVLSIEQQLTALLQQQLASPSASLPLIAKARSLAELAGMMQLSTGVGSCDAGSSLTAASPFAAAASAAASAALGGTYTGSSLELLTLGPDIDLIDLADGIGVGAGAAAAHYHRLAAMRTGGHSSSLTACDDRAYPPPQYSGTLQCFRKPTEEVVNTTQLQQTASHSNDAVAATVTGAPAAPGSSTLLTAGSSLPHLPDIPSNKVCLSTGSTLSSTCQQKDTTNNNLSSSVQPGLDAGTFTEGLLLAAASDEAAAEPTPAMLRVAIAAAAAALMSGSNDALLPAAAQLHAASAASGMSAVSPIAAGSLRAEKAQALRADSAHQSCPDAMVSPKSLAGVFVPQLQPRSSLGADSRRCHSAAANASGSIPVMQQADLRHCAAGSANVLAVSRHSSQQAQEPEQQQQHQTQHQQKTTSLPFAHQQLDRRASVSPSPSAAPARLSGRRNTIADGQRSSSQGLRHKTKLDDRRSSYAAPAASSTAQAWAEQAPQSTGSGSHYTLLVKRWEAALAKARARKGQRAGLKSAGPVSRGAPTGHVQDSQPPGRAPAVPAAQQIMTSPVHYTSTTLTTRVSAMSNSGKTAPKIEASPVYSQLDISELATSPTGRAEISNKHRSNSSEGLCSPGSSCGGAGTLRPVQLLGAPSTGTASRLSIQGCPSQSSLSGLKPGQRDKAAAQLQQQQYGSAGGVSTASTASGSLRSVQQALMNLTGGTDLELHETCTAAMQSVMDVLGAQEEVQLVLSEIAAVSDDPVDVIMSQAAKHSMSSSGGSSHSTSPQSRQLQRTSEQASDPFLTHLSSMATAEEAGSAAPPLGPAMATDSRANGSAPTTPIRNS